MLLDQPAHLHLHMRVVSSPTRNGSSNQYQTTLSRSKLKMLWPLESPWKELKSESFHGLVALLDQKLESSEVKSCDNDFCKMDKKWYKAVTRQRLKNLTLPLPNPFPRRSSLPDPLSLSGCYFALPASTLPLSGSEIKCLIAKKRIQF